ncbi:hypothetical protein Sru01_50950 [Sphaerisporangium rufum]|uniref:Chorismate mutase domain-containing protein n=1 Tax=Sphaerisporangium rufum TaxID=1381558 RepID=A0A919V3I4_9ACTN|nr:chorismate mutase [Sphaerisporangium rufum]GII80113.1 hypothetical protein Sru01_50950 [Sphaerisporangium rufum]
MSAETPAPPAPASLAEVRARIDEVDGRLTALLAERQRLVRAAATFKTDERAVRAPDRVAQVVAAARDRAAAAGLSPEVAEAVWRAMIGAFIEYELAEHRRDG